MPQSGPADVGAQALRLPPQLREEELCDGPQGGWGWEDIARRELQAAGARGEPIAVSPVALAALSARSDYRARRGLPDTIGASLKLPANWSSGLLSALAARAWSDPLGGLFLRRMYTESDLYKQNSAGSDTALSESISALGIPDQPTRDVVIHALEDLCRNVFQHASTQGGGAHVAVSYEPRRRWLRLAVADCGKGIAADIRDHLGDGLSDERAVEMALEPKVSGSEQPDLNQGVGLYIVRRLALAGAGKFLIKTDRVVATADASNPRSMVPQVNERGERWKGTVVSIGLKSGVIDQCEQAIWSFRSELSTNVSRAHELQFYKQADDSQDGWTRARVLPDEAKVAYDRVRALRIAEAELLPLLRQGGNVTLDFHDVRTTTQAFCYALLARAARDIGLNLMSRIRFVAASDQVRTVIRLAVHSGFDERESAQEALPSGVRETT